MTAFTTLLPLLYAASGVLMHLTVAVVATTTVADSASGGEARSLVLGFPGESCFDACFSRNLNCRPWIRTLNSADAFASAGYSCPHDGNASVAVWAAAYQPAVAADGMCQGYINVSGGVSCQNSFPSVKRLCTCAMPNETTGPIGMSYSQGFVSGDERTMFSHVLTSGAHAFMSHFWLTPCAESVFVRYYVDGESTASIAFRPWLASGVGPWGRRDSGEPWGTKWFGKGAANGSWSWNFPVPFHRSIRVTIQDVDGNSNGLYMILRGAINAPLTLFGGAPVALSSSRRLQFSTNRTLAPLETVDLASVPAGTGINGGAFFMHTLAIASSTENCLEGCYHWYSRADEPWPGMLLSSGTEDYFDSGWYFNGGEFRLPVSGATVIDVNATGATRISAYRFHDMDPLYFGPDGMRFQWRNGDMMDASFQKCYVAPGQAGGVPIGDPQPTHVLSYAWVYTW